MSVPSHVQKSGNGSDPTTVEKTPKLKYPKDQGLWSVVIRPQSAVRVLARGRIVVSHAALGKDATDDQSTTLVLSDASEDFEEQESRDRGSTPICTLRGNKSEVTLNFAIPKSCVVTFQVHGPNTVYLLGIMDAISDQSETQRSVTTRQHAYVKTESQAHPVPAPSTAPRKRGNEALETEKSELQASGTIKRAKAAESSQRAAYSSSKGKERAHEPAGEEYAIEEIQPGSGDEVESDSEVEVLWTGAIKGGGFFSPEKPSRMTFQMGTGAVVKGWEKAMIGMKVGAVRKIQIPPHLAYGRSERSGIPGNSTIIITCELTGVQQQI